MSVGETTDGPKAAPSGETEGVVRTEFTVERQKVELGRVATSMLTVEAKKRKVNQRKYDDLSEEEKALKLTESLRTGQKSNGKAIEDLQLLDRTDPHASMLLMPGFTIDVDGEDTDFATGDVCISRIVEVIDKGEDAGKYLVEFAYTDGKKEPVTDDGTVIMLPLPKETVYQAQINAEKDRLAKLLTEPQQEALDAFDDSLPQKNLDYVPPDNIDDILEKAAKDTGLPTTSAIVDSLINLYPEPSSKPEVANFITKVTAEGSVIVNKEDFLKGMELLGIGKGGLDKRIEHLQEELRDESTTTTRKEQITNEITMLNTTKELWEAAEGRGESPMAACYDRAMEGELPKGLLDKVLTSKNVDDVLELFGNVLSDPDSSLMKGLTDEQRKAFMKAFKSGSWKTLKYGGMGTGILALIIAALAAAVVVGTAELVAATGKGMTS